MKLIVGLGNPGEKYIHNRHNAGFLALDFILQHDAFLAAKPKHDFKSQIYEWQNTEKVVFMKPQTYMNDSGQALRIICNFYKMDFARDLLVIHDEADLPFGAIRSTGNSSSAGHNGVKSIIENLGTQNFQRLRIGIESRAERGQIPTENFVLQDFSADELEKLQSDIFPKVMGEVINFLKIEN